MNFRLVVHVSLVWFLSLLPLSHFKSVCEVHDLSSIHSYLLGQYQLKETWDAECSQTMCLYLIKGLGCFPGQDILTEVQDIVLAWTLLRLNWLNKRSAYYPWFINSVFVNLKCWCHPLSTRTLHSWPNNLKGGACKLLYTTIYLTNHHMAWI